MKKWLKVLIAVLLIIGVIFAGTYIYLKSNLDKLVSMEAENIKIATLKDGTYIGEYTVVPVSVTVEVQIHNGKIEKIKILDHGNGMGQPAEVIIEDVIASQSLDIDSISGATYSSRVIIKAIEEGLKKAR